MRAGRCVARRGKNAEERIALRVDLDPGVRCEQLPQERSVLDERVCVRLVAEILQQCRRALDVGEEKGHRPSGQLVCHVTMMRLNLRR
jgi:hypothetical protein